MANGHNASAAARAAGYTATAGIRTTGSRLLKAARAEGLIEKRLATVERCGIMSAQEVLQRLSDQGRGSHADVSIIGPDRAVHHDMATAIANGKAHLIKEIVVGEDGKERFKLHDSQRALVTLAKHHRLIGDAPAPPPPGAHVLTAVLEGLPAEARVALFCAMLRGGPPRLQALTVEIEATEPEPEEP